MSGVVLVLIGLALLVGVFFARAGHLRDYLIALGISLVLIALVSFIDSLVRGFLRI